MLLIRFDALPPGHARPRCKECGHETGYLVRYVMRDGRPSLRIACEWCEKVSTTMALPRKMLGKNGDLSSLPTIDNSQAPELPDCTVCDAPPDEQSLPGPPLDPVRGVEVASQLRALGAKRILVRAAELGYITQARCAMPKCWCPEELGGAEYFEPVTAALSDWSPTLEHFPIPKREGGRETIDNAVLAHRLCNRMDFSITSGQSHKRDLERIERARQAAVRRYTRSSGR
jgi:hypothetical protein